MARFEKHTWGGLALRGLIAIVFGIVALMRPGASALALVYLFGAYAIIDGIFALVASYYERQLGGQWWPMMLVGFVGVAVGVFTFLRPAVTAFGLIYYVAFWTMATGILEIAAAVRLRKVIHGEWMLIVAGVLSIAVGILLAARPGVGMLTLVWTIGIYAIFFGVILEGLALRVRRAEHHPRSVSPTPA
jgi:uncharacterized membrane protein HdeD (DUF308 family)